MGRKIVTLESREHWLSLRQKVITSTEISALFDCNPYMTKFELWHYKNGSAVQDFESTERMTWGSRLEPVIAQGVSEDLSLDARPYKDFIFDDTLKLGASYDYVYGDDGILEIKNVDGLQYKQKWTEDEAPLHIELQVQLQMFLSGRKKALIAALVGGNEIKTCERTVDDAVINAIKKKASEFWALKEAPTPDFQKDADFIMSISQFAEPNTVMTATPEIEELARAYKFASQAEKEHAKTKDAIKAQLMTIIGSCEKVKGNSFSISAGITGPSEYTVKRKAFRNFKLTWKETQDNGA